MGRQTSIQNTCGSTDRYYARRYYARRDAREDTPDHPARRRYAVILTIHMGIVLIKKDRKEVGFGDDPMRTGGTALPQGQQY